MRATAFLSPHRAPLMIAVLILLLAGAAVPARAGDSPLERSTLKGIRTVGVFVDPVCPDLERNGLTPEAIQSEIEQRLRQAGISVVPSSQAQGFLAVDLNALEERAVPTYAVTVGIAFVQPVLISQSPGVHPVLPTWSTSATHLIEPERLPAVVPQVLRGDLDRFISAFVMENPKR